MTFKPTRLLIALAAAAVVAAPSFAQNVAVVNGKAIPMSLEEAIVKQVVARGQQPDSKQLRDEIKQDLISHEVLYQEAVRLGVDKSPEAKAALEDARKDIIFNAFVQDFASKHKATDAEMKAVYDTAVKQHGDKEYHVRHILLANEADAKAAIAKIKGGAKFEDVAKASSKDEGSAGNGGDLEWVTPAALPPEFGAAVTALAKGAVTETPVKTQAGYHVIKIDDVRPVKVPTMEQVKPQLARQVEQRKLAAFEAELAKKSKLTEKSVPEARVDEIAKAQIAQGRPDSPELREQIRKALLGRDVLLQEAMKQGFGTRADVKAALDQARQAIGLKALVADFVKKHPVSDADLKAEYDKYKAHMGDKEYKARHILVPTEEEAKKIIAKIKGGAKFEDLAKAESKDTSSAVNGGEMDWMSAATLVPEFSAAMTALQKGQMTATPVKTQYGYHVIELQDVRATTYPPLDQVKGEFEKQIQNERLGAYRDELMKKAKVQ